MAEFIELKMEVRDRLLFLGPEATKRAKLVLAKASHDLEARAKAKVPVRTGALKNSIRASMINPMTWEVVVGQNYGVFVEFGTRRMRAQPFFTPAFQFIQPVFVEAMAQVLREAAFANAVGAPS